MVVCEVALAPDKPLVCVEAQPYFRGTLVIAEDMRRQYIVISQSTRGVQSAIQKVASQTVSLSSLQESALRQQRKGVTGGTWSLIKLDREAAIKHWNSRRRLFGKGVVAAWRLGDWHFE